MESQDNPNGNNDNNDYDDDDDKNDNHVVRSGKEEEDYSNDNDSDSLDELSNNNDRKPNTESYAVQELDSDLGYYLNNMISAMVVAEEAGVQMMHTYFELEAPKATLIYGFRKRHTIFGNKGYQATIKKLKGNLIGCGCIDVIELSKVI